MINFIKEGIVLLETYKTQHNFNMILSFILNSLRSYFEGLYNYMKIDLYEADGKTLVIKDKHVGFLLPMKCGHRGKPNRIEERDFENLLRQSGFLDAVGTF